ncbi:leucyl aminopeptidase [bacterium]|jgi:leucyl aminopeptidase|nr:leucyl aminopeptidase [bacterium]
MSKIPALEAKTAAPASHDTDVIGIYQDSKNKGPYAADVEKLLKLGVFKSKAGQVQFLRFAGKSGADNVAIAGLGAKADLTEEKLRSLGGSLWARLSAEKSKNICVHLDTFLEKKGKMGFTDEEYVRALAEGLILNCYSFDKYKASAKEKKDETGPEKITFLTSSGSLKRKLETELAKIEVSGTIINIARDWSNEPSNVGTPEFYAKEAMRLAKQYGLKCKVLSEAEARKEKMNLFLGVGQGSEREGKVVVVDYTPKKTKNAKTIALVGKGITFDTGGISIKPSMRMEEMKHDMTGAATVMAATLLAAAWEVPNRVVAFMGFTENMPDGDAITPGNVIETRNGKTVEVINTDAEGRLILADVLDYAQDIKPDAMIDVATLTGAVGIALGKYCCAVLGNDDSLVETVKQVGENTGERMWQLPLYDDYFDDMKSDTADMRNSCNDSHGGTIRGAIFLKQFIRPKTRWAHMDIASTAYNVSHLSYMPKRGASGLHVRTLARFAAEF